MKSAKEWVIFWNEGGDHLGLLMEDRLEKVITEAREEQKEIDAEIARKHHGRCEDDECICALTIDCEIRGAVREVLSKRRKK